MNKYSDENNYDKISIVIIFTFFSLRFILVKFANIDIWQYPYFLPDSWDWLANGLYYAGYSTNMSYRPPIFPLLISLFYKNGSESMIPMIGQFFSMLSTFGIYLLSSKLYNKEIGIFTTILFLMSGYVLGYSVFVLSDIIALTTMIFSFYFFILGASNGRYFVLFGVMSGFAFLTQYIGILIIILVFGYILLNNNIRLVKRKEFIVGIIFYILTSSIWFIYRWSKFGDPFYSSAVHIQLLGLRLNFGDMFYYIWSSIGFISIICIMLAIFGLLAKDFGKVNKFILFWILTIFSFFAFIYSYNDNRFIIYWIVPILFLSSSGLWKIKKVSKILFIVLFIVSFLSINMIRIPIYNASYIPIIPGYDLHEWIYDGISPSLEKTDLQSNNFAYLLFYQNMIHFPQDTSITNSIEVTGANLDPLLANVSTYVHQNSKKDNIIGIWPVRNDGDYTYTVTNQISVVTRRHVVPILRSEDLMNNILDFIIIEDRLEKVKSLDDIGYETIFTNDKYTILKKSNLVRKI